MRAYNVVIATNDGRFRHVENLKAIDEKEAITLATNNKFHDEDIILSITVVESPMSIFRREREGL